MTQETSVRILLVEDEPLIAIDLETILNRLGHEVVGIADTFDEAIQLAKDTMPDAAFVDLKLRDGFTGQRVAKRLRDELGVYCAFVTGNSEQIRESGFVVVSKPFTSSAIQSALPATSSAA
jgi:CheY-like chemotaxis protein